MNLKSKKLRNEWERAGEAKTPPVWLHAKGKLKHILEERHLTVVVCWGLAVVIWALLKKPRSLWSGWLVCTMSNNYSCSRASGIIFVTNWEFHRLNRWLYPHSGHICQCVHTVMSKATHLNKDTAGISGFIFSFCGQPLDCIVFSLW